MNLRQLNQFLNIVVRVTLLIVSVIVGFLHSMKGTPMVAFIFFSMAYILSQLPPLEHDRKNQQ